MLRPPTTLIVCLTSPPPRGRPDPFSRPPWGAAGSSLLGHCRGRRGGGSQTASGRRAQEFEDGLQAALPRQQRLIQLELGVTQPGGRQRVGAGGGPRGDGARLKGCQVPWETPGCHRAPPQPPAVGVPVSPHGHPLVRAGQEQVGGIALVAAASPQCWGGFQGFPPYPSPIFLLLTALPSPAPSCPTTAPQPYCSTRPPPAPPCRTLKPKLATTRAGWG